MKPGRRKEVSLRLLFFWTFFSVSVKIQVLVIYDKYKKAGLTVSDKIYFLGRQTAKNNIFNPHRHTCYEAIYFLKGSGTACINGTQYAVSPHNYCIVPPNTEHVEHLEEDGEILFVGFRTELDITTACSGMYTDQHIRALPQLEAVLREYKGQRLGYKLASEAFLQLFLVEHLRAHTKDSKDCRDLDYIKTYLKQYYGQHIDFRELSKLTGYSCDYFRHVFKKHYGISPQEYLINIRLEAAKNMLQTTNLSCTQIAASCGFSNSAQMTMMIKRKFRVTPTALRKNRFI